MSSLRRASIFSSGGALLGRLVRSRWIARVWRTLLFFFGLDFSFIPPVYPSRREVQIGLDKRTKTLTWDKWPEPCSAPAPSRVGGRTSPPSARPSSPQRREPPPDIAVL